ncbi:MAG: sensor histidine kinase [Chloroflexia bacterium]
MDLGSLFLLIGLLGSILLGIGLALWGWAGRCYEQALSRLQREQADAHRRFLRRLDHEIKNPLTAIRAGLANLPEQSEKDILASVRAQVDRLARLSSDLRKLADLEVQPIEQGPVDLASLLTETVEVMAERPAAQRLSISLPRIPWPLPPVLGDRDLLFLALHNLLDNALSSPGRRITSKSAPLRMGHG